MYINYDISTKIDVCFINATTNILKNAVFEHKYYFSRKRYHYIIGIHRQKDGQKIIERRYFNKWREKE